MLVIERRDQEKVKIFYNGGELTIIVAIEKGRTRLIFDAPREVSIWRTELLTDGKLHEERPIQAVAPKCEVAHQGV